MVDAIAEEHLKARIILASLSHYIQKQIVSFPCIRIEPSNQPSLKTILFVNGKVELEDDICEEK